MRHAAAHAEGHAALIAPMPGRVVAVRAAAGASVAAHATVVVIEAMKMEHAVTTPIAGVVGNVAGARGRPGAARRPAGRGIGERRPRIAAVTAVDVRIYEVGPRDGLQAEPTIVATEDKLRFIAMLADAGLREIETTSLVSPEGDPAAGRRRRRCCARSTGAARRALPGAGAERSAAWSAPWRPAWTPSA